LVVVDGADKLREGAKVELANRDAAPGTKGGKGGFRKRPAGEATGGTAPGGTAPGGIAPRAGAPRAVGTDAAAGAKAPPQTPPNQAAPASAAPAPPPGGGEFASPEERRKRWAEMNARIDRGEFGEEIKKLSEDDRKQRIRELRSRREAAAPGRQ
jgi:multidrug efflux system membrane fusion protein